MCESEWLVKKEEDQKVVVSDVGADSVVGCGGEGMGGGSERGDV